MGFEGFRASVQAFDGPTLPHTQCDNTSSFESSLRNLTGPTTYKLVQDVDSDDAYSVVESIFSDQDTQSIASSQSSDSSAGSDSSEDGSDGESSMFKAPRSSTLKSAKNSAVHRESGLSGLSSQQRLPIRTVHTSRNQEELPTRTTQEPHNGEVVPEVQDYGHLARRRSGADCSIAPPRLKRDTEKSDCFVGQLICKSNADIVHEGKQLTDWAALATRLITAIWPLSACPPMMSSSFNGAGVLPLEVFIHETLRRSKTSFSTLQVALWYLVLLKCQLPSDRPSSGSDCRAIQCGRRMFLAALMLASKYLQDRNYSTRAWSKISGLRMGEINQNEMNYLKAINYSLHMKKDTFDNWHRLVLNLSKLAKAKPGCSTGTWQSRDFSGFGHQNSLAAMVSDTAQPRLDLFTCEWWQDVLRQLNPSLCETAQTTDSFLRQLIPPSIMNDPRMDLSGDSPSLGFTGDTPFNEPYTTKSHPSGASTPVPYTQSPAEAATTLPMQPHLRNLPTPVSTPRQNDACPPWLLKPADQTAPILRCAASIDTLRNLRKQCLASANLDRCPPPRPQSYHCATTPTLMENESKTFSRYPSPAPTQLEARSRSSSISSTASYPGTVPGLDHVFQYRTSEPSPLTRVASMPESPYHHDVSKSEHGLRRKPSCSNMTASSRQSPTVSSISAVDQRTQSRTDNSQSQASEILLQMAREREVAAQRARSSCLESRGHKRTISTSSERSQEICRSTEPQSYTDTTFREENTMPQPMSLLDLHKGWQMPSKSWATPKKPLARPFDCKRIALPYCASPDALQQAIASEQAALYSRNQSVSA